MDALTTNDSSALPDIGTLWNDDKHGLLVLTGIVPLGCTGFNERLYTFHLLRVSDSFHTNGIFTVHDWHTRFTHVA
jgi:hypothetical protein